MSCGCGGSKTFPLTVLLRMEAARIANSVVSTGNTDNFKRMANEVHSFLIAGLGDAGEKSLDRPEAHPATKPGRDQQSVFLRNSFLNAPVAALLTLPEGMVDTIETCMKVTTIGALAQYIIPPAGTGLAIKERVEAELGARGLQTGMTVDQLASWIKTGTYEGQRHGEEEADATAS